MSSSNKHRMFIDKFKKINKLFSCILIICFLAELPLMNLGCYSYYSLNNSPNKPQDIKSHDNVKFILKDKSEVEASSKDCYFFERDTALFYGIGLSFKGTDVSSSKYVGFIDKGDIDSITYSEKTQNPHWLYWLKNDKMLVFEKDKIIDLSKFNANKQWLVLDADHTSFRVIPINNVNKIQFQKANWVSTVIVVIGIIGFFIAVISLSSGSFLEGWNNSGNWHL